MTKFLVCLLLFLPVTARADGLQVFVAASMIDVCHDLAPLWQARGHAKIVCTSAASSTLARQIDAGAPADVFISADEKWMDFLAGRRRIVAATRVDIVGNTLVLVEQRADSHPVDLKPGVDIAGLLGPTGRLALGDPAHVPAGIYAKQALIKLEAWDAVAGRLAPAESVRDALELVKRGEAPAGIVYGTDVRIAKDLAVAGTFPADSHDPILYPAAVTAHATGTEARDFVVFLTSGAARDVYAHYGFLLP